MPLTVLPTLHTPRLTLRPLTLADTDAVYQMIDVSRDSYSRWFIWSRGSSRESVKEYIRQTEEAMTVGTAWHYVAYTPANRLIGRLGLTQMDAVNFSAELGYMLCADAEGYGYMTEAAHRLLTHAFGPGGLHRIVAYADVENAASHQVLRRLGFQREGTVRHMVRHPERGWRDHHAFGLLEGELRG